MTAEKNISSAFRATVNYIQPPFVELRLAFNWVDREYRKAKFRAIHLYKTIGRDIRDIELEYIHLNYRASTNKLLTKMDKRGLRPALYEELLAFAKQYPDEQRQFPIIALGSVWVNSFGERRVACLGSSGNERDLSHLLRGSDWSGRCRFLAVKK